MKKFKSFLLKYGTTLSALALILGTVSANSACFAFYHQPKVPASMDRYKK
ncbi:MAG: cyclic lactone autoinducer peptide [Clostridia bacterium]|nr:cyclic lactone autoinducer peptide [Clostridia bacterium]MBO5321420.1 cyclic lactone autoinducer peptide [Clostridia bacterium]